MYQEKEIDLLQMKDIILKRKWIIIYITVFSVICAAVISFFLIKPVYQSKVSIVIAKEEAKIFYEDRYTNSDIMMYQKLVKTYSEIAMANTVLQKTADSLENYNVNQIRGLVTAVPKANTQIIELKVKNERPSDAANIANEFAKNFILESKRVLPAGDLSILDNAVVPESPLSPNKKLNIAIAFFLGLMVSIGIVFFIEYIDVKVRTEEHVEQSLGIPVLVSIPNM